MVFVVGSIFDLINIFKSFIEDPPAASCGECARYRGSKLFAGAVWQCGSAQSEP
jgi:hypothetical protein